MSDEILDTLVRNVLGPWPLAFGEPLVLALKEAIVQAYNMGVHNGWKAGVEGTSGSA